MISTRTLRAQAFLVLLLLLTVGGCLDRRESMEKSSGPTRPIADVLADHAPSLMAMQGVVAVGQGALPDGTPCIRVFLKSHDRDLERRIPSRIEGHPVDVKETGEIRAMPGGER